MYQSATLQPRLFAESSLLRQGLACSLGIIFLSLASHLIIPLQPVPLTFQSAAVILLGMIMGPRLAAATLIGYLTAGFIGLPVFAPNSALGPSMGYLIGFLPAAIFSGWLAERGMAKNILQSFIASILGAAIIFSCGLPVLAQFVGWQNAINFGLLPFIISEPLKLLAISLVVPRFWQKSNK